MRTYISYLYLLVEYEVDGAKSDEMTDTVSNVSDTCIRDLCHN